MLFKGTQQFRLGEIARTLFLNGASFNASTYYDWTNYYATIAADRLELAMRIEADRMVNSRIDKADLESEMTVVRSELEGGENSPGRLLWQAVVSTAFQAHPYRWPVIGWRSDVENVSRDAIYQYYRTHYGPDNAVAVVVGDVTAADALRLARQYFGPIKPIPKPPEVHTTEPPQRGERRVIVRRSGSLPMVLIAWKAPAALDPDTLRARRAVGSPGRGPDEPAVPGAGREGAGHARRRRIPEPPGSLPLHGERHRAPGRHRGAAREGAPRRGRARDVESDHRGGADPRPAARRGRLRLPDEQRDGAGPSARLLGDGRRLALSHDVSRPGPRSDRRRHPGGGEKTFTGDTRTVGHFVPSDGGGPTAPPPREASARVERPKRGDRPIPLPRTQAARAPNRLVTRFSLDNGISVIVQENHATPTVALRASVPAGSLADPRDKPGLAGFTAAMLSRGTVQRSALGFATALEDVGAGLGASADTLVTSITGEALTRDFDLVLDLFAEMLRQPAFPAADFDRLKSEALAGVAQAKTNPDRIASLDFDRAIYPAGHPLRPQTFEEAERTIPTITRDDLVDFHRRQYGPDRMIVVVTGDVAPDQVREALQKRLGDWPRNPETRAIAPPDLPLRTAPESLEIPGPGPEPDVDRLGPRRRPPPERPRLLRDAGHEPRPGRRLADQPAQHVDPRRPGTRLLRLRLLRRQPLPGPLPRGPGNEPREREEGGRPRSSRRSSGSVGTA